RRFEYHSVLVFPFCCQRCCETCSGELSLDLRSDIRESRPTYRSAHAAYVLCSSVTRDKKGRPVGRPWIWWNICPQAASSPDQVLPIASVTKTACDVFTCEAAALALANTSDRVNAPSKL